ncbi:MAG TPA: lmo0937 family membrane protein [Terriglobales bacterium]|nr:lmo0937 family membrane protein [Terriglobales bacterium]
MITPPKVSRVALFLQLAMLSSSVRLTTSGRNPAPHQVKVNFGGEAMLWALFVILLIAWILGLVGTYQIGAFVWLLLVAALIVLVLQLVTGRRPVV